MPAFLPHTPVGLQVAETMAQENFNDEATRARLETERGAEATNAEEKQQQINNEAQGQAREAHLRALQIQGDYALRGQQLSQEGAYQRALLGVRDEQVQNLQDYRNDSLAQKAQGGQRQEQGLLERARQFQQKEADAGRKISDEEAISKVNADMAAEKFAASQNDRGFHARLGQAAQNTVFAQRRLMALQQMQQAHPALTSDPNFQTELNNAQTSLSTASDAQSKIVDQMPTGSTAPPVSQPPPPETVNPPPVQAPPTAPVPAPGPPAAIQPPSQATPQAAPQAAPAAMIQPPSMMNPEVMRALMLARGQMPPTGAGQAPVAASAGTATGAAPVQQGAPPAIARIQQRSMRPIPRSLAQAYFSAAGGDKDSAKAHAAADGYDTSQIVNDSSQGTLAGQ